MTFEPPSGRGGKKQEVVKVTPATSSLQAKNESGGMIVSTRVIVHKKSTHTHIVEEWEAQMWCVYMCVPARVCVCDGGSERVSLQM